jgi:glutamate racemase
LEGKFGKIGIFDSGLGGLTVLKETIRTMPDREYIYLGDNLHAPYGDKSQDEIFRHTSDGVEWLFDNGAEIVILACNTSSSNALRRIQQESLPLRHPDKKVLGIIIPTVENLGDSSRFGHIGVLATRATVDSMAFEKEIRKHKPDAEVVCQSGGDLVELIESNGDRERLSEEIRRVVGELISRDRHMDTVILGCTHYALVKDEIRQVLPENISLIDQGGIVAEKLADYIERHGDIQKRLNDQSSVCFFTTSDNNKVKKSMLEFFGRDIAISTAVYESG